MRHLPFHGMPLRVQMFYAFFIRLETTDKKKATPTITFMVSCCFVWVMFYASSIVSAGSIIFNR